MNLNGDYISDALAAQVGGIGIAPGANINYLTGHAIFEATHGTAPKYAGQDKVNPGSVILSGEMMFRYLGWNEAADLIITSLEKTIAQKRVTYDFERLMDGRDAAQDQRVREGDGREHVEAVETVRASLAFPASSLSSSLQPVDLPPVPLRRPPLLRHEGGVQGLELERHRLARRPALRPLLVEPRRRRRGPALRRQRPHHDQELVRPLPHPHLVAHLDGRARLARSPFTCTLPPAIASAASERVL